MISPRPSHPGATVIAVEGELNAMNSPALRERIAEALDDGARLVVIDLARASFIDSSGLSVLVRGLKSARLQGRAFALAGLPTEIRPIFEITQADRIFTIFGTLEEALADLPP